MQLYNFYKQTRTQNIKCTKVGFDIRLFEEKNKKINKYENKIEAHKKNKKQAHSPK